MAFHNLRDQQRFAAEVFKNIAGLRLQLEFNKHQQILPQRMGVEAGVIAFDDAFALEAAYPFGYRRGGKADFIGQFRHRDTGVLLQQAQDFAVGFI